MAQFFEQLSDDLIRFIQAQPMFFTASGTASSRINLSPKGMDSLRVLNNRTVAYLDITGSGNETAAHIKHDGRLTIMFCSFVDKPLILRLYGKGEVVRPDSAAWGDLSKNFPTYPGQRQIIVLRIESLQTSCGFGVPKMQLVEHRDTLVEWASSKGEEALVEYRAKKNIKSIDGLPTGLLAEAIK